MHRWTISEEQSGKKLKSFISESFPEENEKEIKKLLENGLRLNGLAAKATSVLNTGDIAELYTDETKYGRTSEVVYEDENFFVVNKEQNISCYTNKGDCSPALYDFAVEHMIRTGEYNVASFAIPYICHGIDTHTGGLILIAKDEILYNVLTEALSQRRIRKLYKCVVAGVPEEESAMLHDFVIVHGKFDKLTIAKHTMKGSNPVGLKYKLLATNGKYSLLEVDMITDHIYQICAQLALHGLPVLGDELYGDNRENAKTGIRLPALWAYKLEFDVGKNNTLEYLDNTFVQASHVGLPYIEGLGT